jgi:hypothetical protein
MDKIKLIIVLGLFILFLLLVFRLFTPQAESVAPPKVDICHCESRECHTLNIAEAAAVSHLREHDGDYRGVCEEQEEEEEEEEEEDEPTPSPEPTKTPDQPVTNNATPAGPPAHATCNITFEAAEVWYSGDQFNWATSVENIDKFSIVYGKTPDSLIYGIDNIPADSRGIEINGRDGWSETWWQVWTWRDSCAEKSEIIDP